MSKKLILVISCALMVACGSESNEKPVSGSDIDKTEVDGYPVRSSGTATGVAQHGPIRNATISAYSWETGSQGEFISSTNSNEIGEYELSITYKNTPVWITTFGGDYQEESSSRTIAMGQDELKAIVAYESGKTINVQLTFFTNTAACFAEYLVGKGEVVNTAITQANEIMTAYAGVPITATRPIDVTQDRSFTTQITPSHRYGMVIAGISEALEGLRIKDGAPENSSMYTSKALATIACEDAMDGLLDGIGKISESNPSGQLYIGSTALNYDFYRTIIAKGVLEFASNENNKTGLSVEDVLPTANAISTSDLAIFGETEGGPVDTVGPTITNKIAENTLLSGTVDVEFVVSDPVGLGDSEISFFVDGDLAATSQNSDPTMHLDTSPFADGDHTIKVVAQDVLGNISEAEFTYVFANAGPGIAINSPTLVNNINYTVTGTYTAQLSPVSEIVVRDTVATLNKEEGTWSASLTLEGGSNDIEAVIYDGQGNSSTTSFVVDVDLFNPNLASWATNVEFTNYDGQLNTCELGRLDISTSPDRPICFNAELTGLEGKAVSGSLVNDGYIVLGVDLSDPKGSYGIFSDIENIKLEYRVFVDSVLIVDWQGVPRPNPTSRLAYLPVTTEYFGDDFFLVNQNDKFEVNIRATDEAGNDSTLTYNFTLDVLTPPVNFNTSVNADLFKIPFSNRSSLIGRDVVVSYSYQNLSNISYLLKFDAGKQNRVTNTYESAIRKNKARIVSEQYWNVWAINCTLNTSDPCEKDKSGVYVYKMFYRIQKIGVYSYFKTLPGRIDTVGTTYSDWEMLHTDTIPPPANESVVDREYLGCRYYGDQTYNCGAPWIFPDALEAAYQTTLNTEYTVEYAAGYPRNEFVTHQNHYDFVNNDFSVVNLTEAKEIYPVNSWYLIPKGAEIKIEKKSRIPLITHYTDSRVSSNAKSVPYTSTIYEDKEIRWDIDTNLNVTRAIFPGSFEALDKLSETESTQGKGIVSFKINRS